MTKLKCDCSASVELDEDRDGMATCYYCGNSLTLRDYAPEKYREKMERERKEYDVENGTLLRYKGKGGCIYLPIDITAIGDKAFYDNPNVYAVVLPKGLRVIGRYAFSRTNIVAIEVPEGVTNVDENAFAECYSLNKAVLPRSIRTIGDFAFHKCTSLTDLSLNEANLSIGEEAFSECENIERIDCFGKVAKIGKHAFVGNKSLKDLVIGGTPTIDKTAFNGCKRLTVHFVEKKPLFSVPAWLNKDAVQNVNLKWGIKK